MGWLADFLLEMWKMEEQSTKAKNSEGSDDRGDGLGPPSPPGMSPVGLVQTAVEELIGSCDVVWSSVGS